MNSNAAKLFRQFAEERFNTHFNELNTKYQNQSVERTARRGIGKPETNVYG